MHILCIGDSLTEGDYGCRPGVACVKPENYPYFLSRELGCTVCNAGKCGYNATQALNYYLEGNIPNDCYDVILVMLGTNLGLSYDGDTTHRDSYRALLCRLKEDYPSSVIVCLTPPHATVRPEYPNCGYEKYVENARKDIIKIAKELSLPLIDVWKDSPIQDGHEEEYQPVDGLHLGRTGYALLASFIAGELKKAGFVK